MPRQNYAAAIIHLAPSAAILLLAIGLSGCAALTNPVATGVPVNLVPDELLAKPFRERMVTIPLHLLTQPQPDRHRLAYKDVLGVFIYGVLPATVAEDVNPDPPVYFPSQIDPLGSGLPPSLGYPITINQDGYIFLPLIEPLRVDGMTVDEAREAITSAYFQTGVIREGRERVFISLMTPRQYQVTVIREEEGGFASGGRGDIAAASTKRGTGHVVYLRAYENDVLNAIAKTGGLPGLDAYAEIVVFKRSAGSTEATVDPNVLSQMNACGNIHPSFGKVIRIPTRILPNQILNFRPEDITLEDGDVVLLEARAKEVFYTGGLLPSTEQILPRDRDLDVLEAIGFVKGPLVNGAFGGSNLSGTIISEGVGNPSPKQLTVVRRTPNGGQIPIEVDLARALRDSRERILVQPGDLLVLQETPDQAIGRWLTERFDIRSEIEFLKSGSAIIRGGSAVRRGLLFFR